MRHGKDAGPGALERAGAPRAPGGRGRGARRDVRAGPPAEEP